MSESRETTVWDKIHEDIRDRSKWEERLPVWYRMRHTGIPRRSKPYPGAPDLHLPLADTLLEKLKPFYYKQLFASEHIADLTSQVEQLEEWTEHATRRFDYELKLKTNLLTEIWYVIDAMLANGLSFMRQSWNPQTRQIEHLAIEPRFIIVPPGTEDINKAFRFVHVEPLTRDQYAERKRYNQDPEFIKTICGAGVNSAGSGTSDAERERREGITQASSREQIVIWNVWERKGAVWSMTTRSAVKKDAVVAPPLRMPFSGGPFAEGELPYVDFRRELKEKGIYSSRGEVEKVAPFEVYACRVWNKKAEALDHFATPLYTSEDAAQDGKNVTFHPGSFVPRGVRRVDMGQPPFALDSEIERTRAIAEQRAVMPDFGIGDGGEKRTATEIEQLAAQGGISTEMRAHIFRLALQRVLKQDWALFCQYRRSDLDYIAEKKLAKAPPQAIHGRYAVDVGGTSESWNKKLEAQKTIALFQQLKNDGYVDQLELRKMLVEKTDSRWVSRLIRDPQQQANTEAVDEMVKLPAVMEGAPIPVEPQENHQVRAEVVWQKLRQLSQSGAPLDPVAQKGLSNRLNQRLALWAQVDGKTARAWWRGKQTELKAEQQQREQAAAANVVPFALGGAGAAPPLPMAGGMR